MGETVQTENHLIEVAPFRRTLLHWGKEHFRSFPWRLTDSPYRILMAEVMLHRTQATQVVPVYQQFIEHYPNVWTLSQTTRDELHQILFPLGLHWRIDLIHTMIEALMEQFKGKIPASKEDLLSLPGVGEYIASAVRCFAWNQPESLIDTNTVRIVGRLFGLEIKDSSRRNRQFRTLITSLVDPVEPQAYNYAMLDLADQICMKKQLPACEHCPVQEWCAYGTTKIMVS